MRFAPASLGGVFLVDLEPHADERGSFTRVFSVDAFAREGLHTTFPEHSIARNTRRGVLRGLHYQAAPHEEIKVVRCVTGRVWDVLVDLRPDSPSYGRWEGFALDAARPQLLYVPAGIAHGYQTLSEEAELSYLISTRYAADAARGVAWDSPALAIPWPDDVRTISARDRALPPFSP